MAAVDATSEIDKKDLRSDIDRLCRLGVIRRGLVLRCEACTYLGSYPLIRSQALTRSARCGAQNPLTLERWNDPIEEPMWWYDLPAQRGNFWRRTPESPCFARRICERLLAPTQTCQNSSSLRVGHESLRLISWRAAMTRSSSARQRAIPTSEAVVAVIVPRRPTNSQRWLLSCMLIKSCFAAPNRAHGRRPMLTRYKQRLRRSSPTTRTRRRFES
jgi:hypothetical protein